MLNTHFKPDVSVDIVLLTLVDDSLHVGLLRRQQEPAQGEYTLIGGYVHADEDRDLNDTVRRVLLNKTGLKSPYFEQLCTMGSSGRDPRGWSVSVSYYALAKLSAFEQVGGHSDFKWVKADDIKGLPLDHLEILGTAVDRVRDKARYSTLPLMLMSGSFTLSDLQSVYESVLGAPLEKSAFRRRIEALGVLDACEGVMRDGSHRPAQLFKVKRSALKTLVQTDNTFKPLS